MTSVFDPDTFMNGEVQGANATKFDPVPLNDEGYVAIISSDDNAIRVRSPKEDMHVMEVMWEIDMGQHPELEALKRNRVVVRQSIFLDIGPNGELLTGPNQNVGLGRVREVLGQNDPKKPWAPRHLAGAGPARVYIKHRENPNTGDIYDEVVKVGKV